MATYNSFMFTTTFNQVSVTQPAVVAAAKAHFGCDTITKVDIDIWGDNSVGLKDSQFHGDVTTKQPSIRYLSSVTLTMAIFIGIVAIPLDEAE